MKSLWDESLKDVRYGKLFIFLMSTDVFDNINTAERAWHDKADVIIVSWKVIGIDNKLDPVPSVSFNRIQPVNLYFL